MKFDEWEEFSDAMSFIVLFALRSQEQGGESMHMGVSSNWELIRWSDRLVRRRAQNEPANEGEFSAVQGGFVTNHVVSFHEPT